MSDREIFVAGTQLLLATLSAQLAIGKAMKARDYVALAGAAQLAFEDAPGELAMTDPARYRALRQAITTFNTKGFAILDRDLLREKAFEELELKKHQKSASPDAI